MLVAFGLIAFSSPVRSSFSFLGFGDEDEPVDPYGETSYDDSPSPRRNTTSLFGSSIGYPTDGVIGGAAGDAVVPLGQSTGTLGEVIVPLGQHAGGLPAFGGEDGSIIVQAPPAQNAGGNAVGNIQNILGNTPTNGTGRRSNNGQLHLTHYGYDGDHTSDYNSNVLKIGNRSNRLNANSVAVSRDLIRQHNLKGGEAIYINGQFVGYYDDTMAESLTNTLDIYDPNGALGRNSFFETIAEGDYDLSFGAPGSHSSTVTDSAESQARAAFAVENGVLFTRSRRKCARGANNILSYYVNGHEMAHSGANANEMGPILQSRYGMTIVEDTGTYKNGDTRILYNSGFGHMETYMNGNWYSDFAQGGSLMGSGNYSRAELYRL